MLGNNCFLSFYDIDNDANAELLFSISNYHLFDIYIYKGQKSDFVLCDGKISTSFSSIEKPPIIEVYQMPYKNIIMSSRVEGSGVGDWQANERFFGYYVISETDNIIYQFASPWYYWKGDNKEEPSEFYLSENITCHPVMKNEFESYQKSIINGCLRHDMVILDTFVANFMEEGNLETGLGNAYKKWITAFS